MSTIQTTSVKQDFSNNVGTSAPQTFPMMGMPTIMPMMGMPTMMPMMGMSAPAVMPNFNNNLMGLVPSLISQTTTAPTTDTSHEGHVATPASTNHSGYGAGSEYVDPYNTLESLSGLPYAGWIFGGTRNGTRDAAVDAAIAAGNVRSYGGSDGGGVGEFDTLTGSLWGNTVGRAGLSIGEAISRVPFIGHNVDIPVLGQLSLFDPILNIPFGQIPMNDEQIRRNAIYNFGPRADAFEQRGDTYGQGVAAGLRGTQVSTSDAERIPLWDDAMDAINTGLGFVSGLNIPVISFGADALRSVVRGARGDSTYDWLDGRSRDPMDPTFTVFGAPANIAVSYLASRVGSLMGMDKEAMDYRLGRAVGDAMNVYDVFLPGDHTLHAWGSFLPRAILGSSDVGNNLHDHVHQHELGAEPAQQ